ncbi:RnfABCDGE type electron transport complex subunit G [Haliea sp. E17]|uniref:RnfABCDGE type electron transport complex subunit G n=1 Tax=Haliea sp. E17 TaxID=3401576 RepID=UPI003AAB7376
MATPSVPSYRNRMAYHAGLLGGICCLVSVLLILGNMETSARIADHLEQEKRATLAEVLPSSLYDNEPLSEVQTAPLHAPFTAPLTIYTASLKGQFAGAALQSSIYGWGGDIQFIAAIDGSGTLTGVRVLSHRETPGLADKIEVQKDDWIEGFTGKSLANTPGQDWAVRKDGGEFDQFTGATITPRAVVRGVHASLQELDAWRQQQLKQAARAQTTEEGKK